MNRQPSFLAATAFAILWAGICFAHAHLQSSVPAANAQLGQAPSTLTLNFSEKAQLAVLKVTHAGNPVAVPIDRTLAPSLTITVPLPALEPGKYEAMWTAIAHDDGHVTKGSFSFSVIGPLTGQNRSARTD
jgi:methionine-rich copper-binding protein CopC